MFSYRPHFPVARLLRGLRDRLKAMCCRLRQECEIARHSRKLCDASPEEKKRTLDKRLRVIYDAYTIVPLVLFERAILVGDRVIFHDRSVRDYGRPPGIQITGKSLDTRPRRVKRTAHLPRATIIEGYVK